MAFETGRERENCMPGHVSLELLTCLKVPDPLSAPWNL